MSALQCCLVLGARHPDREDQNTRFLVYELRSMVSDQRRDSICPIICNLQFMRNDQQCNHRILSSSHVRTTYVNHSLFETTSNKVFYFYFLKKSLSATHVLRTVLYKYIHYVFTYIDKYVHTYMRDIFRQSSVIYPTSRNININLT